MLGENSDLEPAVPHRSLRKPQGVLPGRAEATPKNGGSLLALLKKKKQKEQAVVRNILTLKSVMSGVVLSNEQLCLSHCRDSFSIQGCGMGCHKRRAEKAHLQGPK